MIPTFKSFKLARLKLFMILSWRAHLELFLQSGLPCWSRYQESIHIGMDVSLKNFRFFTEYRFDQCIMNEDVLLLGKQNIWALIIFRYPWRPRAKLPLVTWAVFLHSVVLQRSFLKSDPLQWRLSILSDNAHLQAQLNYTCNVYMI